MIAGIEGKKVSDQKGSWCCQTSFPCGFWQVYNCVRITSLRLSKFKGSRVGALVFLFFFVITILFVKRKRRKKQKPNEEKINEYVRVSLKEQNEDGNTYIPLKIHVKKSIIKLVFWIQKTGRYTIWIAKRYTFLLFLKCTFFGFRGDVSKGLGC